MSIWQGVMRANAHIGIDQFDQQIMMDDAAQDRLQTSMDQANLLARTYHKIMRILRMIADLAVIKGLAVPRFLRPWPTG